MDDITIREGKPEDAPRGSELAVLSAPVLLPYLFGPKVGDVIKKSFQHVRNCFSFEHAHFIEVNGEVAGMALMFNYNQRKKEELRSLLFILRYLRCSFLSQFKYLRKSGDILAQITESDAYLAHFAVYPKFRSLGFGTRLIEVIEEEAKTAGSKGMVLDVETDNERAIKLYERLGYSIEHKSPILRIRDKDFEFFKMSKDIDKNK